MGLGLKALIQHLDSIILFYPLPLTAQDYSVSPGGHLFFGSFHRDNQPFIFDATCTVLFLGYLWEDLQKVCQIPQLTHGIGSYQAESRFVAIMLLVGGKQWEWSLVCCSESDWIVSGTYGY